MRRECIHNLRVLSTPLLIWIDASFLCAQANDRTIGPLRHLAAHRRIASVTHWNLRKHLALRSFCRGEDGTVR
jgi:hypothetical protein